MTEYTQEYFDFFIKEDKDMPELPLMESPCSMDGSSDCAVNCGFYQEISNDLKTLSLETQLTVSKKWFCHNNPSKACRGNADNLGISW